jgi:hypothetical protein
MLAASRGQQHDERFQAKPSTQHFCILYYPDHHFHYFHHSNCSWPVMLLFELNEVLFRRRVVHLRLCVSGRCFWSFLQWMLFDLVIPPFSPFCQSSPFSLFPCLCPSSLFPLVAIVVFRGLILLLFFLT